ncbi:MAG: hypothetical protein GY862_26905 [Gammaproteobacteria bacterium]|nr:hypothetical protein [Gammaproteobacteria bacterium]MCP5013823.1 hypothetical protein [Ketobacter sp.]
MTASYANEAADAAALLAEAGTAITLKYYSESAYTPGGAVTNTEATETASGVLLDYEQRERDGSTIQQFDQRCLMAATLARTPQTGDVLVIAGVDWQVINNKVLAPVGVPVLHDVQVRR